MRNKLSALKKEFLEKLEGTESESSLNDLRTKYLGRKGRITLLLKGIAGLAAEEKKMAGQAANEAKKEIEEAIKKKSAAFSSTAGWEDFLDVTLPGEKPERGHIHIIAQIMSELEDIFSSMGFMVLDGPELESDYFNFEALNIPPHHPARDAQDTFYVAEAGKKEGARAYDLVMRTHTSPAQVRAMKKYGAPLRAVVTGKVFRNEATDAVHENTFCQLEGLMIDENISIANLIAVLKQMLSGIFRKDVKVRVRPGYFPFVEPGLEVDMACAVCGGKGCPSCKHSGWLEMLGAGMVHPNVLKAGGIDSKKYSGFAFGLGIDRLAIMRHGINDIRLFHSGDLRFLKQF